jgi:hypothetical protein
VITAPPTPGEQWTFQALGPALEELEAQPSSPEHLLWLRTWTVLGLMHSLDDQAKKRITQAPYYRLRAASDDGLTLAALTMVRDLAHHEGHQVQPAEVHRGMEILAAVEGGLVPLAMFAVGDGGLVPLQITAPSVLWRPYAELPPWPTKRKRKLHDRDAYYRCHVEGRSLMEPLRAAQRFLAGLQQQ